MSSLDICPYWAHSENAAGSRHRLSDHLKSTAALARSFAEAASPGFTEFHEEAYWAGLWHDLGKYSFRFQQRLVNPSIHGVDHWRAGAVELSKRGRVPASFAVFGHHIGLPDHETLAAAIRDGGSGVSESLKELQDRFANDCAAGMPPVGRKWPRDFWSETFLVRLVFSCLVDADFLDTERHFDPAAFEARGARPVLFEPAKWLTALDEHIASLQGGAADVKIAREKVLRSCVARAEDPTGLFSLTVPTGGGKTLASLAFALRHALRHGTFERVIVVLPYTSIIEQTAGVYRSFLGDKAVLEHHSSREPSADPEEELRYRLGAENWDAPLVVTTQVQFFESLFSNRPSSCRKLHSIARSIIILDEVQTLTGPLLRPLLAMIDALCRTAGCTAVLATATPNCLGPAARSLRIDGWSPTEIMPDPDGLARQMRRARIVMPERFDRPTPLADVAAQMAASPQALCIVNRKDDAEDLYRHLPVEGRFHLSTRMCPAHRSSILAEIRRRLRSGETVRVSATQCIEAGVDVDFPALWRALGPLDSILQAAGRCNREGKRPFDDSVVRVFVPERQPPSGTYAAATQAAEVFSRLGRIEFGDPGEVLRYFDLLFSSIELDRVRVEGEGERAVAELTELWRFDAIARSVRLIRDDSVRVVVPNGRRGRAAIRLLKCYASLYGRKPVPGAFWRAAAGVCVSFYAREAARLKAEGAIRELPNGALVWEANYDAALGCVAARPEDMIV